MPTTVIVLFRTPDNGQGPDRSRSLHQQTDPPGCSTNGRSTLTCRRVYSRSPYPTGCSAGELHWRPQHEMKTRSVIHITHHRINKLNTKKCRTRPLCKPTMYTIQFLCDFPDLSDQRNLRITDPTEESVRSITVALSLRPAA